MCQIKAMNRDGVTEVIDDANEKVEAEKIVIEYGAMFGEKWVVWYER